MRVGEAFRVISDPAPVAMTPPGFVYGMYGYCGKVVTIAWVDTTTHNFQILEDGKKFWWHPSFVVPITQRTE